MIEIDIDGDRLSLEPEVLVVAGYTGADETAVRHHIEELASEGVAPPPRVPMYWSMPPATLSQQPRLGMPSAGTSGEIELALIVDGAELFVAAGSDHTCRIAEATDIRLSKLICPTPLGRDAWRWADVADSWQDLELSSTVLVDGTAQPYQRATAGANVAPQELLANIPWADNAVPSTFVLLCGTVPTLGGIHPAERFEGKVADLASGRTLTLTYDIEPVVALGALSDH